MNPRSTIAAELIALLEGAAAAAPLPRVRALHLPRPETLDTRRGEFCALELEDGTLGLAFVLLGDTWARLGAREVHAGLVGADTLQLARGYAHDNALERTLGMAAINAASRCVFDRIGYVAPASADSIGELDPRAGDHVGMVGLFGPLLGRCTAAGARVTVIELREDLVGEHDGYRVTLDAAELAACNKVLCTSSVLLNGTADSILGHCAGAAHLAMIGPGAGCLPDPLFGRGVTLFGGSWITDARAVVEALRAGESWSAHARKYAIRRDEYAGLAGLAAAAGVALPPDHTPADHTPRDRA
ncbi:MAG: hypothetical protein KJZ98_04640 [Burkholderiaceae bacterium]|nr:hypothetical protein [Burkholderiaceae bacterium]MEB2350667.1 DUF364 domain-containing protein [Burkholderiaceae bacterium]